MTRFKIDKGIPLPPAHHRGRRSSAWPWGALEIGDSVLLSEYAAKTGEQWAQRNGRIFTRRKQADGSGYRLWRKA